MSSPQAIVTYQILMTGSATQLATGLNATCPFLWYFLLNSVTLVDMYINTLDHFL